jgi:channel protein (hemolysin III family)
MLPDSPMIDSSQQIPELCHVPGCHEPVSAVSHLAGAAMFLFLGALLLRRGRGDCARLAFLGIYVASCLLLFSMSGVYHMLVRGETAHRVVERLDHAAIFVLVAGTFTPIHGLLFHGWYRWGPLALVWGGAITGITLKMIFFEDFPAWLGLSLYLTQGWIGIFGAVVLARRYGLAFIRPLLLGGLAYSIGGFMELRGWLIVIPGWIHAHELFHIAVLFAALFHWRFIWQIAGGETLRPAERMPA